MHPRVPLFGAVLVLASCAKVPDVPAAPVVLAVFDPTTNDVPTPNDLAMSNGKVAIVPAAGLPAAEVELELSMNGADGFSLGSAPRVRFTGGVSQASFSATTVYSFDLGATPSDTPQAFTTQLQYADCDNSLSFLAPNGFTPGHRYLFAVRGGDQGVQGAHGERVDASPAFFFLRSGQDLRQHPDAFPGATRAERQASADQLEAVRQGLEPLFQLMESQGLPRREVAILWTFTARQSGELWFDPGSKQIPMPNDLLKDPATGLVSLPVLPGDSPDAVNLKKGLSKLDGFSTTAALTLSATLPLDRTTVVAGQTVRLFRRDTMQEVVELTVSVSADNLSIAVQPTVPLRPATPYVVVVSGVKDLRANPVARMPLATLLTLKSPLVAADGSSNIRALCAATAAQLEPLRAAMAPAVQLAGDGATAFTFTTQDLQKRFDALYAIPYQANLPLQVDNVMSLSPPSVGYFAIPNVSQVVTGTMTTLDFLDPTTRAFRDDGQGVPRAIPFILTLPANATQSQPLPVVVFGHGLMTERRLGLFVADKLAQGGFAMMAIDFPLHGERTPCLNDTHCSLGGKCAADGTCWNGTTQVDLARLPNSWPGFGPGTPSADGQAFIDVANLFGGRDHFRQAMIDLSAQTRLLEQMDWRPVTGGYALEPTHLKYVGISLGGIVGGAMAGVDPSYSSMLLNVGGAGFIDMMQESTTFGPILTAGLAAKGILPGTPQFSQFQNAAKWVMDEVDPINLARFADDVPHVYRDPLSGATLTAAPKRLRLQMAIGDTVVPNAATDRLVVATGIDRTTQFMSFVGTHGFLADSVEPSCGPGQQDMADFLGSGP